MCLLAAAGSMRRAACNKQLGDYAHVAIFAESDQHAEAGQPAADLLGILPRPLQVRRVSTAAAVQMCHTVVPEALCHCGALLSSSRSAD